MTDLYELVMAIGSNMEEQIKKKHSLYDLKIQNDQVLFECLNCHKNFQYMSTECESCGAIMDGEL